MASGGGKAGSGTGSSSGTACKTHTEGALVGHDWRKEGESEKTRRKTAHYSPIKLTTIHCVNKDVN